MMYECWSQPHFQRILQSLLLVLCFLASPTLSRIEKLPSCWEPCASSYSGVELVPGTDCTIYQTCHDGVAKNRVKCGDGLLYNAKTKYCDYYWNVECEVETQCPPTLSPTESPTFTPTESPTSRPTKAPTKPPSPQPTLSPSYSPTYSPTASEFATPIVRKSQSLLEQYVFISYTSSNIAYPSIQYTFDDFYDALRKMADTNFGTAIEFFLANFLENEYKYGLVNVAAFLANAMVESIQYDTCDELNWQALAGQYAISNSCGQQERSYQDEVCEEEYTCEVDMEMEITAVDSFRDVRDPPPFTCGPRSGEMDYSGYWDISSGTAITDTPYLSTTGRTDVEGCCWWGRGALLTKNVCNIGKINYYLGKRAALDGRRSLYPNTDFCLFPEATCSSSFTREMRWTVAMFEWADRVQNYATPEWAYGEELIKFVDGGMRDDSFIMSVGRILSNGCHEVYCSADEVRMLDRRKENFYLIINDIFQINNLNTEKPTQQPSIVSPTQQPSIGNDDLMSQPVTSPSHAASESHEPTLDTFLITLEGSSAVMRRSGETMKNASVITLILVTLVIM